MLVSSSASRVPARSLPVARHRIYAVPICLGGSRAARLIATSTAVLYLLALATLARATRLPFPATPRRRASRLAAPPQGPPCWREIHGLLVDFPFPSEMVNSLNLEAPLLHQELTVAIVFRVVPSREEAPSHHLEG